MKGIIRENLGDSRYIVGVAVADQPLADELKKYQDLYDATIPRITDAYGALNDLRDGYNAALDAIAEVAEEYELCRLDFSSTTCIETGEQSCLSAYSTAESACRDIESAPGECDPDCLLERERCILAAQKTRDACLAQVAIDCAEAEFKHVEECQKTWAPLIAKAQEAALKLLPGMQEALYNLQHEQALQWQLARKLNELAGIAAREYEITCFRAQYDDGLEIDAEVEMARTPNGRHVITGLVTAPTPCLHDARVLPSGHLFVNAALWPGFETWRPTWRVGIVKEVIAPNLKIEFAPANMPGGLGTLYTENPLDCTPPQIYFDGKSPLEAEADIKAARAALKAAQQDLLELVKVRTECIAEYDQAWMDQCYGTAVELCDIEFGEAMEQPTLDRGQCYEDAQTNCQEQTEAGLAACTESYQPAIDEAQAEVDAAQALVEQTAGDLIAAQAALASAELALATCLAESETPETCSDEFQPAIDAAQRVVDDATFAVVQAGYRWEQATDALRDATQALTDCNANWVLGECLDAAIKICDDTYALAEETYTQRRAACYQEALAECDRQRDEAIQACYDASAEAIAAAQTAVDAATRDIELATNGRYNPANPLILDCPVAHCGASEYQVGDEVLIDFPVREGSAMAVWDSRRVIGWAQNTRTCCCGGLDLSTSGDLKSWYLLRRIQALFGWEEINTPNNTISCDDNALYIHSEPTQGEKTEVQFFGLGPVANASMSFEVMVAITGDAIVTIAQGAEEADNYEILFSMSSGWTRYCYNYLDWIGPRIGLWTEPGSTAKVWIRNAKGPPLGFCEINAEDDSAAMAALADLRASRDAASLAYQDFLAAKDACYTAASVAYTQAKIACQSAYPLGYCVNQCMIFGAGDIWECLAECGATLQDASDYNACIAAATSDYNAAMQACNDIYTAEAQAAAAAASIAAQQALDDFFNLHAC